MRMSVQQRARWRVQRLMLLFNLTALFVVGVAFWMLVAGTVWSVAVGALYVLR